MVEAIGATAMAPLHNRPTCEHRGSDDAVPKLPHVAVFDTAFHRACRSTPTAHALPEALYREHGVRRYGFHGTSHRYVSHRAAKWPGWRSATAVGSQRPPRQRHRPAPSSTAARASTPSMGLTRWKA
ncbi:hypothetical protein ACPA9J_10465 [Pseudomonas aeruginosa]